MEKNFTRQQNSFEDKVKEINKILENMGKEERETLLFKSIYENDYTPMVTLNTIFDGTHAFRIPVYQRGYVWTTNKGDKNVTKKQLDFFWEDLSRIYSLYKDGYNVKHYMGMLSLERMKEDAKQEEAVKGHKAYYVVDGQQRLTTLIILSNLIQTKLGKNFDTGIFGYSKKANGTYNEALNLTLKNEGSEKVKNENGIYLKRLLEAKEFFAEKLEKLTDEELEELYHVIKNNLQFNVFFGNGKETSIVFETINNRGKGLTKLEVLKNRIYCLLDKAEYDGNTEEAKENNKTILFSKVQSNWEKIFENLGQADSANGQSEESDNRFLLAWGLMEDCVGSRIKGQEELLIEQILENFSLDKTMKYGEIKDYMSRMENFSTYWMFINNPNKCNNQKMDKEFIDILEKFRRLTNDKFIHSLITGLCCSRLNENLGNLSQFLAFLEKYIFCATYICIDKTSTDYSFMIEYGKRIYKEKSLDKIYQTLYELKERIYNKEEDAKRLKGIISYDTLKAWLNIIHKKGQCFYEWNGIEYFLYERNWAEDGEDVNPCGWDNLKVKSKSIEHVYPETPKDDYWKVGFSLDAKYNIEVNHCKTANSIGNLLPLSMKKNNKVKNYKYFKKRKEYRKGTTTTIRFSADYDDWNIYYLAARNQQLLDWIITRWFTFDLNISYTTKNGEEISIKCIESLASVNNSKNIKELKEVKARLLNFSEEEWDALPNDKGKAGIYKLQELTANLDLENPPTEIKECDKAINQISIVEEAEEYSENIDLLGKKLPKKNKILLIAQLDKEFYLAEEDLKLNDYGIRIISLPINDLDKLAVQGLNAFINNRLKGKCVSIIAEKRLAALLLTDNNIKVEKKIIINPSLDYDEVGVKKAIKNPPANTYVLVENNLKKGYNLRNSDIKFFDDSEKAEKITSFL